MAAGAGIIRSRRESATACSRPTASSGGSEAGPRDVSAWRLER